MFLQFLLPEIEFLFCDEASRQRLTLDDIHLCAIAELRIIGEVKWTYLHVDIYELLSFEESIELAPGVPVDHHTFGEDTCESTLDIHLRSID
jgi:hypothetical protein